MIQFDHVKSSITKVISLLDPHSQKLLGLTFVYKYTKHKPVKDFNTSIVKDFNYSPFTTRVLRECIPLPRPNTATITYECNDKKILLNVLDPELFVFHSKN